jgi:hypothetical protein
MKLTASDALFAVFREQLHQRVSFAFKPCFLLETFGRGGLLDHLLRMLRLVRSITHEQEITCSKARKP